jgi:hypothetical protein
MTSSRAVATGPAPVMRSQLRLIALCCGALFVPLVVPLCIGRVFTKDDLAAMHLPFRYLYREALLAGDSFLWTPALRSGLYLHGEGEAGFAHPFHFLLYRVLPLGPAFNLEIISSYIAMLAGTGLFLLRLGLSSEAAWFGAMVFTFSGFNLFNLMHVNHIAAVAHVPWLLFGAHVLLRSGDRRSRAWGFACVALAVGSQLLVGNPQYVWLTLVALGYMTACLLWAGGAWPRLPLLLGAAMCGALIGAMQLLPTLDFARESTRLMWSQEQSLSFSLSPLNLVQLWSPFAFRFRVYAPASEASIVHEFIVYNGAFCTVALTWLAMRWRQQTRRGLLTALLVFAAISFVLAMGRYGGLYVWLARLPGLRTFRAPARHLVLFQLALSGIAAVVFEDLTGLVRRGERTELRRLWPLAIPIAASVTITIVAAALAHSSWAAVRDVPLSGVLRAAPWSGLIVGMAVLLTMAGRGARWSVPVLIVFVACDQGFWGYSYAYRWGPIQSVAALAASAEVPPNAQQGDLIEPMTGGGPVNLPLLRGLRLATGYFGLETSSVLDPTDLVTERIAGVAWRPSGTRWAPVPDPMPRARLVSIARRSGNIRADVHTIDISRVALADRSIEGLSGSPDLRGWVRVLEDRPGSIVLDTAAASTQLLVLTERFHGGWRAAQDDRDRETTRVYGDYLGCVVEPGRHRVRLTFAPDSARYGLRTSLAGVLLTLVLTTLLWPGRGRGMARYQDADARAQDAHAKSV